MDKKQNAANKTIQPSSLKPLPHISTPNEAYNTIIQNLPLLNQHHAMNNVLNTRKTLKCQHNPYQSNDF